MRPGVQSPVLHYYGLSACRIQVLSAFKIILFIVTHMCRWCQGWGHVKNAMEYMSKHTYLQRSEDSSVGGILLLNFTWILGIHIGGQVCILDGKCFYPLTEPSCWPLNEFLHQVSTKAKWKKNNTKTIMPNTIPVHLYMRSRQILSWNDHSWHKLASHILYFLRAL